METGDNKEEEEDEEDQEVEEEEGHDHKKKMAVDDGDKTEMVANDDDDIDDNYKKMPPNEEDDEEEIIPFEDNLFIEMFLPKKYALKDDLLDPVIERYQTEAPNGGIRLVIRKGYMNARTYCCASHKGCKFQAKFGSNQSTGLITL